MKYLFRNQKDVLSRVSASACLHIFLDYDGTLAPITQRPEHAIMSDAARTILRTLIKSEGVTVSIVSGRALSHVRRFVGLRGVNYAGCHGLETQNASAGLPAIDRTGVRSCIRSVRRLLERKLPGVVDPDSVDIEDKGLILSLHYRRAEPSRVKGLREVFLTASMPYVISGKMVVLKNKKVFELRPSTKWDKGLYCMHVLRQSRKRPLPVYVGDDKTDETAFKVLRHIGITVFVKGERKTSSAEFYVHSTNEVINLLRLIARART
ncbi:MAG: trehalose-phosphatase [Candidatus Omnitrophota bacterium]